MITPKRSLLSIVIPAYNRPDELLFCIEKFVSQIKGRFENDIEIIISDDHSRIDSMEKVRDFVTNHEFIKYRRYSHNIGLEKNLIECTKGAKGKYLWIFGDDDFLEKSNSLSYIMRLLKKGMYDFYVLNRTRRSFDLSTVISVNWMGLAPDKNESFPGLRQFCNKYGFISVIGFISVNIFRRAYFQKIDHSKYLGTMYPQLGAMLEAFHNKKTLLISEPMICHRTQTEEEKKAALGAKKSEADFMADIKLRNATYFSHPYIGMLYELILRGAFTPEDIVHIPENTVINGLLIDFLIQTVTLSHEMMIRVEPEIWRRTASFFKLLPLDNERKRRIESVLLNHVEILHSVPSIAGIKGLQNQKRLIMQNKVTISVITPSYNQGIFLDECLRSVREQTYKPIEHFVFDPGSEDNSRAIANSFSHVTLIAEPDDGQSDALNKGFQRAEGDIIAWLNSDDFYAHSKVFERVIQRFSEKDAPDIVYGKGIFIDENGEKLRDVYVNQHPATLPYRFQYEDGILQPALFMKRSVIEKVGLLRNDLHYSMDYEYWIRCTKAGIKFAFVDEEFAVARYHRDNKTYGSRGNSYAEVCSMMIEHFNYVNHIWLKRYAEFLAEGHDGVLASSSSVGIKDQSKLDSTYKELLTAYNTSYDTYNLLIRRCGQKGYGDTLREMKNLGIAPQTPCKIIPLDKDYEAGSVSYTVGKRRWAFDDQWKSIQIAKAHEFFRSQIASRQSDTCIIVGNGPSLNKIDLSLLKDQDVIVSNNAFLSKELMEYATYFTVVNYLVAEQSCHHINLLKNVHRVFPYWLAYCLNPGENTYFVDAVGRPEFSKDIFKNMSWRHTVTFFNLHLAYGLGYQRVVMIGFDHSYIQPENVIEQDEIQSYKSDKNHFHADYFRGKKWQAADVDMMEEMYRLAKTAFEEDGREIINSTVGGKLELFQRMPLEKALNSVLKTHPKEMAQSQGNFDQQQSTCLLGPFQKNESVHWDETEGIGHLFSTTLSGAVMIDVGAHHGWALTPFLKKGWKIFAFEPDENNRQKLLERIENMENAGTVKLDARAVSDKHCVGLPFYRSEESTGISGLSAFHPSHQAMQKVDTVTLTDVLADETIEAIDFLKIDTEGHDMLVLKGFPWERFKPAVIECEFEDTKTVPLGYNFHDMAGFLMNKGYQVYVSEWHPIVRYGIRHSWKCLMRYPCQLTNEKAWGNLLAFRDPIDETVVVAAVNKELKINKKNSTAKNFSEQNNREKQKVHQSKPSALMGSQLNSRNDSKRIEKPIKNSLYQRFANYVVDHYPAIGRIGLFSVWSIRTIKRQIFGLGGLFFLLASGFFVTAYFFEDYRWLSILSGGVMISILVGGLGIAYARYLFRSFRDIQWNEVQLQVSQAINDSEVRLETRFKTEMQELHKELNQTIKASEQMSNKELQDLRKQLEKANNDSEVRLETRFKTEMQELHKELNQTIKAIEQMSNKELQDLHKQLEKANNESKQSVEKSQKVLTAHMNLINKANFLNAGIYQNFNRYLQDDDIQRILDYWLPILGLKNQNRPALGYMAHSICQVENICAGRLATNVQDAILRNLVAQSITDQNIEIMEIGSLFGINMATIYDNCRGHFDSIHLTAIDPLEGYYNKSAYDICTKVPINRALFEHNMRVSDIPKKDVTLIQALSTEKQAQETARKRSYNVLIIDGDHSYDGVKFDFDNYHQMVKLGGYIIFDDYNCKEWPDVTKFVDSEVKTKNELQMIGNDWRTAVFKVTKKQKIA